MAVFVSAAEAVSKIKDGDVLGMTGFNCIDMPEELTKAIQKQYLEQGHPRDLTLIYSAGLGDGKETGANHFGEEGLVKRLLCGHVGLSPRLGKLANENKLSLFMVPQGTFSHLHRAAAGHRPGVLTKIGLKTYADPRVEGCRANQAAFDSGEEIVELVNIEGEEYLFYKSQPLDVCFLKATYADEDGNLSFEDAPIIADPLELASSAHNNGGIVIAQVNQILARGSIRPNDILVHNFMVDYIVVGAPENCMQTQDCDHTRREMTGKFRIPAASIKPPALDVRKVCGRRAAMELEEHSFVNLGFGIPEWVSLVGAEEGIADQVIFSVESGPIGGVPLSGQSMGSSYNYEARYKTGDMFDLVDGGCLAMTCLGAAQIDEKGNVNVSKFNGRMTGPGGFVNISQTAKKVCFVGTFTAGGFASEIRDGKLGIVQEGKIKKYVKEVEQITFSGEYALESGQEVLYISERAVFKLTDRGVMLIEAAPGVNIEKDILAQMEFRPVISDDLRQMDERIFKDQRMGLELRKRM